MEVVAQETIMVELEGEAMAIAVQEAQKVPAVLGVGEYGLAVVTAVHAVVASGRAMLILARCAGHRSCLLLGSTKAMSRASCSRRRPFYPQPTVSQAVS